MNITKTIAEQVAKALLKEKKDTYTSYKDELEKYSRELYERDIPSEVFEFYEKYKNKIGFNMCGYCQFSGVGIGFEYVWLLPVFWGRNRF